MKESRPVERQGKGGGGAVGIRAYGQEINCVHVRRFTHACACFAHEVDRD